MAENGNLTALEDSTPPALARWQIFYSRLEDLEIASIYLFYYNPSMLAQGKSAGLITRR